MSYPAYLVAESTRDRTGPKSQLLVLVGTWAGDGGVASTVLAHSGRRGAIEPHGDHWHVLLEAQLDDPLWDSVPWEVAASRMGELSAYMRIGEDPPSERNQTDVGLILDQLASGGSSAVYYTDL
jgi:hypothetical protein